MTDTSSLPACSRCRHWQGLSDEDGTLLGICRCLPPAYEGWPRTLPRDWCGQFREGVAPG